MSKGDCKTIEDQLYHEILINKLLEAENLELKKVIAEFEKFPGQKKSLKNRLKSTVLYRVLRKVKHLIVRNYE